MKNIFKKFAVAALFLLIPLAFASCGTSAGNNSVPPSDNSELSDASAVSEISEASEISEEVDKTPVTPEFDIAKVAKIEMVNGNAGMITTVNRSDKGGEKAVTDFCEMIQSVTFVREKSNEGYYGNLYGTVLYDSSGKEVFTFIMQAEDYCVYEGYFCNVTSGKFDFDMVENLVNTFDTRDGRP